MYVYDEVIQLNIKNVQVLIITKNIKYQSDYRYSVVFSTFIEFAKHKSSTFITFKML